MEFHERFEVGGQASLVVSNIRGVIQVHQGTTGQIVIHAVMDETSGNPDFTRVEIKQADDGTVEAITDYGKSSFWLQQQPCIVRYDVETPADTELRIRNVSGAIHVYAINGDHRLRNVSGDIILRNVTGDLNVHVVSGRLDAEGLDGRSDLETVSGRLQVERSNLPGGRIKTVSGNMLLETPLGNGPYHLQTVSGNIRLVLNEQQACTLNASSISGQFRSDLTHASGTVDRRRWQLRFNGGGPEIRMKSVSGNLKLLLDADSNGSQVRPGMPSQAERIAVLNQVSDGKLTVEEALRKL